MNKPIVVVLLSHLIAFIILVEREREMSLDWIESPSQPHFLHGVSTKGILSTFNTFLMRYKSCFIDII